MSRDDDRQYYRLRAQQERERAGTSGDKAAALIHLKLAEAYESRIAKGNASLPDGAAQTG